MDCIALRRGFYRQYVVAHVLGTTLLLTFGCSDIVPIIRFKPANEQTSIHFMRIYD